MIIINGGGGVSDLVWSRTRVKGGNSLKIGQLRVLIEILGISVRGYVRMYDWNGTFYWLLFTSVSRQ